MECVKFVSNSLNCTTYQSDQNSFAKNGKKKGIFWTFFAIGIKDDGLASLAELKFSWFLQNKGNE